MASFAFVMMALVTAMPATAQANSGLMMPANPAVLMLHNHGPDVAIDATANTAPTIQTVQTSSIGLINDLNQPTTGANSTLALSNDSNDNISLVSGLTNTATTTAGILFALIETIASAPGTNNPPGIA
jgi:hypothetical protein